eukprot:jgi/Chrpa1/21024/Chrysochromulina_OHIO_Genome00026488-RA
MSPPPPPNPSHLGAPDNRGVERESVTFYGGDATTFCSISHLTDFTALMLQGFPDPHPPLACEPPPASPSQPPLPAGPPIILLPPPQADAGIIIGVLTILLFFNWSSVAVHRRWVLLMRRGWDGDWKMIVTCRLCRRRKIEPDAPPQIPARSRLQALQLVCTLLLTRACVIMAIQHRWELLTGYNTVLTRTMGEYNGGIDPANIEVGVAVWVGFLSSLGALVATVVAANTFCKEASINELKEEEADIKELHGVIRIDVKPNKTTLATLASKRVDAHASYLEDHVLSELDGLGEFIRLIQETLTHEVSEGDQKGLFDAMAHVRDVRNREECTNNLFVPLKDTIQLLKKFGVLMPDETLEMLEMIPFSWEDTLNNEVFGPLQSIQQEKVREEAEVFKAEAANFAKEFHDEAPFEFKISFDAAAAGINKFAKELFVYEIGRSQELFELAVTWNELDRSSSPRQLTSVYVSCWVVPSDEGARRPSAGARSRVLCVSCGASAPGSTIATTFGAASAVVLLLSASETAAPSVRGVEAVLALAQQMRSVSTVARFLVLTCGVQASSSSIMHAVADAAHGGAWGLVRVVRVEHAEMHAQSVDVARGAHGSAAIVALAATADNDAEAEAAWGSAGRRQVARLRQCGVASSRSL